MLFKMCVSVLFRYLYKRLARICFNHIHLPAIAGMVACLPLSEAGDVILLTLLALEGRRDPDSFSDVTNGD